MDLKTSKIELAKQILELEDPDLILQIQELVSETVGSSDIVLSECDREEIELGIDQLNRGEREQFKSVFKAIR